MITAISLLQKYGFQKPREGQVQSIDIGLKGESLLSVLKTGNGKSLCFQLVAMETDGITLVISPLIALMKDQLNEAAKLGVSAAVINSTLTQFEITEKWNLIKEQDVKLLYVSPEHATTIGFCNNISSLKIARIVVDEAHCISEWGHDFRPSYCRIKKLSEYFGNPPISAFTATASPKVLEEIRNYLEIPSNNIIVGGVKREELVPSIVRVAGLGESKDKKLQQLIEKRLPFGKILIYSTRIKTIEDRISSNLIAIGLKDKFSIYHGSLEAEWRDASYQKFLNGKAKIMVATKAFGMGVNIPDIRTVIHYDMPETVEALWQEMGRAGRDGLESHCMVLYEPIEIANMWVQTRRRTVTIQSLTSVLRFLTANLEEDQQIKRFNENFARKTFSDDSEYKENKETIFAASIALFQDAELIEIELGKIRFNFSTKKFNQDRVLPISLERIMHLGQSSSIQLFELSYFIDAVTQHNVDFQDATEKYFDGTLIEGDIPEDFLPTVIRNYNIDEENLSIILKALLAKSRTALGLSRFLTGKKSKSSELSGSLSHLNSKKVYLLVEIALKQGYLLSSKVPKGNLIGISDQGLFTIDETLKEPATLSKLKRVAHSSVGKRLMKTQLLGFVNKIPTDTHRSEYLISLLERRISFSNSTDCSGQELIEAFAGMTLVAYLKKTEASNASVEVRKLKFIEDTLNSLYDKEL